MSGEQGPGDIADEILAFVLSSPVVAPSEALATEVLDIEAQLAVDPKADTVEIAAEDWNRLVKLAREVRP